MQEKNVELLEQLREAESGTADASDIMAELWKNNTPTIRYAVWMFTGLSAYDEEFKDMVQQAYFALAAAAKSYDSTRGTKFSTYVIRNIKWELARYYGAHGHIIHIPAYMRKRLRDCAKCKRQLEEETGEEVSYAATLASMGFSPAVIATTLTALGRIKTVSLDRIFTESRTTLLDMIASGENLEETVVTKEWFRELQAVITAALFEIPEDTREIIIRYFFGGISYEMQAAVRGVKRREIYDKVNAAFAIMRTGRYGAELASFMPTVDRYERALEMIARERECEL